jgi:hypothetical protein
MNKHDKYMAVLAAHLGGRMARTIVRLERERVSQLEGFITELLVMANREHQCPCEKAVLERIEAELAA